MENKSRTTEMLLIHTIAVVFSPIFTAFYLFFKPVDLITHGISDSVYDIRMGVSCGLSLMAIWIIISCIPIEIIASTFSITHNSKSIVYSVTALQALCLGFNIGVDDN